MAAVGADAAVAVKSMDSLCDLIAQAMQHPCAGDDMRGMVEDMFRECEQQRPKLEEMAMVVIDQEGGDKAFNDITMTLDRLERLREQKDGWVNAPPGAMPGGGSGSGFGSGVAGQFPTGTGFGAFGGEENGMHQPSGISSHAPSSAGDFDTMQPYGTGDPKKDKKKKDKKDKKKKDGADEFGFLPPVTSGTVAGQEGVAGAAASGFGAWGDAAAADAAGSAGAWGAGGGGGDGGGWPAAGGGDGGFGSWGAAGATTGDAMGASGSFDAFGDTAGGWGAESAAPLAAASSSTPAVASSSSAAPPATSKDLRQPPPPPPPAAPAASSPSAFGGAFGAGSSFGGGGDADTDFAPIGTARAPESSRATDYGGGGGGGGAGGGAIASRGSGKTAGGQQATMTIRCPFKEVEQDRAGFERLFVTQLAQALRVPAHRIRVNGVRPGS